MLKYVDAAVPQETEPGSNEWIVSDPWRCPSDLKTYRETGTSWEYFPGLAMLAGEMALLGNVQHGVSKAYEVFPTKLALLIDADDWHNPRFDVNRRIAGAGDGPTEEQLWDRNALIYGDLHAENVPFQRKPELLQDFFLLVQQYSGGMQIP